MTDQQHRPRPAELGSLPDGPHAAAERGDAGEDVDDGAPEGADLEVHAGRPDRPGPPTGYPEGGDGPDASEHHELGDTAYGNAVE